MEFQARFNRVRASLARLQGFEPDRVYVLFGQGKPIAVVEADAFETLFEAVAPAVVDKSAASRARKAAARPAAEKESAPATGSPSAGDFCLLVLKKKALTSSEVFEAANAAGFKGAIGSIYGALSKLKQSGDLESRNEPEEEGGLRKWFVVKK